MAVILFKGNDFQVCNPFSFKHLLKKGWFYTKKEALEALEVEKTEEAKEAKVALKIEEVEETEETEETEEAEEVREVKSSLLEELKVKKAQLKE